ncbi:MAG: sigma 54-interacting transcriptional regulator [Acidobacteriota bacterium]
MSASAGERVKLLEEIGRGSDSIVHLADDAIHGRVAAKVLVAGAPPAAAERLRREAALLRRLTHPHLVRGHELVDDPGLGSVLLLEHVAGPRLDQAELSREQRLVAWSQVAHAVEALHSRGLVHRDLKPENVLLRETAAETVDPQAVLVDLGAVVAGETSTGPAGTPDYTAPETLAGAPPRASADVFGLGALLHHLLVGQPPWAGLPVEQALRARALGPPATLSESDLYPEEQELLRRLLATRPEDRPPGALAAVSLTNRLLGTSLPDSPGALAARPGLATWVGRAELLSRVDELLAERVALGSGAPPRRLVLGGPSGSGKTRFIEEMALRAKMKGLPVEWGLSDSGRADAIVLLDLDADSSAELPSTDRGLLVMTASAEVAEGSPDGAVLAALTEDECLELTSHLLGTELSEGDGAVLRAATGGLPGRLEQLVASLAQGGALRIEGGCLVVDAEVSTLSERLHDWLPERRRRLSPDAAVLLDFAAVFHGPTPARMLAALARRDETEPSFRESVEELVAGGWLRVLELDGGGAFELPSPLRAAVLEALPEGRRRLLHLAAASLLAREVEGSEARQARQLDAAGASDRAAPLHLQAGRRFLEEGRPLDAAGHLRRAVAGGPEDASAWLDLARAERDCGRADEAVRCVETALPFIEDEEERARALALAAEAATYFGDGDGAEEACRTARRLFRRVGLPRERAYCTCRLALLAVDAGDFRRAHAGIRAALAVAQAEGERRLEARAHNAVGALARREGRIEDAIHAHRRARALYEEVDDRNGAARAVNNLGIVLQLAGRTEEARQAFGEAAAAFEALGDRRERARALNNVGLAAWQEGHLEASESALSESSRLLEELEDRLLLADNLRNRSLIALDGGRLRDARRLAEEGWRLRRAWPGPALSAALDLAEVRRAVGDLAGAVELRAEQLAALGDEVVDPEIDLARVGQVLDEHALGGLDAEAVRERLAVGPPERPVDLRRRWCIEAGRVAERLGDDELVRSCMEWAGEPQSAPLEERAWLALLAGGREPEGERLEVIEDLALQLGAHRHPDLAWRLLLRQARARSAASLGLRAAAAARQGRQLLVGLGASLDEDDRDVFFAADDRSAALEELEKIGSEEVGLPAAAPSDLAPALLEFVSLLNANLDVDALMPRVVDVAIELTGAERGCLILFDKGPDAVSAARDHQGRDLPSSGFQHSRTIVEEVRSSGQPVVVESFTEGDREKLRSKSVHELQLGSASCVPLPSPAGVSGGLLGAIYVDSVTRGQAFTQREVDLLQAIAAHAATAIVNAQLLARVRSESESLRHEVERLRQAGPGGRFEELLGASPAMAEVFELLERVAGSEVPVLIEGESGTGKELVAHALHARSRRSEGPFVAVDCGSLPESLIESELFGHRKGAFTGADRDRVGLFEQAKGGTLLLDEIAGTSPALQAKLLRALQEKEIRRVGENESRSVDVRVLAACNRRLADEVAAGRFREDLYYRLDVVAVRLPPLRDRAQDIPQLSRHFLREAADREKKEVEDFSPNALSLLCRHRWPGNVRELRNVVERAVVLASGERVESGDLPPSVVGRGPERAMASGEAEPAAAEAGNSVESGLFERIVGGGEDFWAVVHEPFRAHDLTRDDIRALVSRALAETAGSYKEATRLLGIEERRYKKFMDFLRQNRCHVDFRPFRQASRAEA